MFLPIRTDSPLRSTPYANWALIVANLAVFIATASEGSLTGQLELSPRFPAVYQFITYQFVHAGLLHLAGNMLFLYIFGNNVNDKMGNLGYLAFYLAGGVVAGLAYVMTEQGPAPIIGASGSIAAVTGAYLILFPRSHVSIFYFFLFIGRFELQALWFIALFFAQDVLLSHGGQDDVAHMAHIGGTVFGTLVCLALLVPQLLPRDQFDVWALIQRWNKRRQYRDLVAKGYNPFDHTQTPGGRGRPAPVDGRVIELRDQITAALGRHQAAEAADLYLQLKAIDPNQVLSRQAQQDVATQLHQAERYPEAAEAYESLLRTYPKLDRLNQIELMLGLLYARYLHNGEKARIHLAAVAGRTHEGRELEMAREELAALGAAEPVARPSA
jgi:membrane associated rhomboid family serine protease